MKRELAATAVELAGVGLGVFALWMAVSPWLALGALSIVLIAVGFALSSPLEKKEQSQSSVLEASDW